MTPFRFSTASLNKLSRVHPHLQTLAHCALAHSAVDFAVTEGMRTYERQVELLHAGATKILDSRHLTGHAIDVVPIVLGKVRWDWPLFHIIHRGFIDARKETGIKFEWGGNWETYPDGPHFQLPWKEYPKDAH